MQKITAAGGVLHRLAQQGESEVLLIFRRGVWDLPKGKVENGETIKEGARREVQEEVGCSSLSIRKKLCTTFHTYKQGGTHFGKTTHWYSMVLKNPLEPLRPEKEEGIEKLQWMPVRKAIEVVGYENLKDVLNLFIKKEGVE